MVTGQDHGSSSDGPRHLGLSHAWEQNELRVGRRRLYFGTMQCQAPFNVSTHCQVVREFFQPPQIMFARAGADGVPLRSIMRSRSVSSCTLAYIIPLHLRSYPSSGLPFPLSLSYAKLHDLFILVRLLIFVPGKNIKQPKKLSLATIFTHSNGSSLLTRNLSASTTTFPESPFKVQTSFT